MNKNFNSWETVLFKKLECWFICSTILTDVVLQLVPGQTVGVGSKERMFYSYNIKKDEHCHW